MVDGGGESTQHEPPPDWPPEAPKPTAEPTMKYDPMTGKRIDRPSRKPLYIVVILVAMVLLIAGIGYVVFASGGSGKHTVYGLDELKSDNLGGSGIEDCFGLDEYADFQEGTDVEIRDEDGTLIGAGTRRNGSKSEIAEQLLRDPDKPDDATKEDALDIVDDDEEDGWCILLWDAEVDDAKFYSIKSGDERGELTYSKEELIKGNWFARSDLEDDP